MSLHYPNSQANRLSIQHEKICVIDQAIAFTGGIDLCFGRYSLERNFGDSDIEPGVRWDTPQHVLVDDTESDTERSEIWPGE